MSDNIQPSRSDDSEKIREGEFRSSGHEEVFSRGSRTPASSKKRKNATLLYMLAIFVFVALWIFLAATKQPTKAEIKQVLASQVPIGSPRETAEGWARQNATSWRTRENALSVYKSAGWNAFTIEFVFDEENKVKRIEVREEWQGF